MTAARVSLDCLDGAGTPFEFLRPLNPYPGEMVAQLLFRGYSGERPANVIDVFRINSQGCVTDNFA